MKRRFLYLVYLCLLYGSLYLHNTISNLLREMSDFDVLYRVILTTLSYVAAGMILAAERYFSNGVDRWFKLCTRVALIIVLLYKLFGFLVVGKMSDMVEFFRIPGIVLGYIIVITVIDLVRIKDPSDVINTTSI